MKSSARRSPGAARRVTVGAAAGAALGALLVLALTTTPAPVSAQELTGIALGPEGAPLTDTPVVLHSVGGGSGAFVATDTTGADGGFRFALEPADSAIYFAAVRYEDRLYIGPAVPAGGEPVSGYVLRVEPGSEAGAVASALSGQRSGAPPVGPAGRTGPVGAVPGSSDAGAFVLLGLLTLGGVGVFVFAAPRYRHRRTRDAVVQLATVENALADRESPDDRARLEAIRDRLRKQLAPRT